MSEETQAADQNIQANDNSVAVGNVTVGGSVEGSLIIGSHNVVGFTSDQVSALITQISTTFQIKPFDGRCPYKGLETFNEEDSELFFGREKWIENLLGRIKESRTLFVTGQSGSGKSSLVRAGVIPCLKNGYGAGWLYATMKPGRDPIDALVNAFSRLKDPGLGKYLRENAGQANVLHECAESVLSENTNQRLVLYIDQFEEVFTQLSKDKAQIFINLLDHAATVENGRVIVLFSMRSDFVPNCATYPQLNAILNQQFVQIGAMQPQELVSAIAQPALRVGLKIDPDLIAQIINDMKGEPGALPLMQFALKDLFDAEQAKGGMIALTLSDYLEHGGISQALERHANASLAQLTDQEKELARNVFSGLIEIGRGTQDTRRTALSNELIPAGAQADAVKMVVQKLASARLITTDATTVTISHEKLIDAWPWLKKLVNENRDVIALQNEIAADAKEWEEHKRDSSYLYSGARLATAREKMTAQKLLLSGLAQNFIEQSIALQDAERKSRETLRRRITIGLVSGIAIALVLAASAVSQSRLANKNAATAQAASTQAFSNLQAANAAQAEAENQKATAESSAQEAQKQAIISRVGELAAQAVVMREDNLPVSLLLSVEAYKSASGMFNSDRAETVLVDSLRVKPQLKQFLNGHSDDIKSVAFSPDGKTLAFSSNDNTIILWDIESGQPIGQPLSGHTASVNSLVFSPDGKSLASGSSDSTIILWSVETHQIIGQPLKKHTDEITQVKFSPDGKTLASGSYDTTIILWDVQTHQPISQPLEHSNRVSSLAFSPDGKILASGSCGTIDLSSYECQGEIILWNIVTYQPIGQPLSGHSSFVDSVAFSPDGKMLVSSGDKTIILWDIKTRQPIGQPLEYSASVTSVAFSPDGKSLATAGWGLDIIIWDVSTRQPIGSPLIQPYVMSLAFSPDGKTLVSGSFNRTGRYNGQTLILWDLETHEPLQRALIGGTTNESTSMTSNPSATNGNANPFFIPFDQTMTDELTTLAFSPDGKILASGYLDGQIILWNISTGQPMDRLLSGHSGKVTSLVFSPDGKTLASGTSDFIIIFWNMANHQPIGLPLSGNTNEVTSVTFSPDGKILASGSRDYTIILWDVATHQPIGQPLRAKSPLPALNPPSYPGSVAFSPDGKTLASDSLDKSILLWDVQTRKQIGKPLSGHVGYISGLAFSLDGKTLVSGSEDNTIIIWDVLTRKPIGKPLGGHLRNQAFGFAFITIAFDPTGKTLASAGANGDIILWNAQTHQPVVQQLIGFTPMVFSPDGNTIASAYTDGSIILRNIAPDSWAIMACQRAGRNFTRAEWEQYGFTEPYRKTCEQWPPEPEVTATPTVSP